MLTKNAKKIINILFLLVPALTLLSLLFWITAGLSIFQSARDFLSIFTFGICPFLLFIFSLYFLLKVNKNLTIHKQPYPLNSQFYKRIYIFGLLFLTAVLMLVIFAVNDIINEEPPHFFPFDDTAATYTIKESHGRYSIHYKSTSNINSSYVCTYPFGGEPECGNELNNDIEIMVADSPIDLKPFVNRNVKVEGKFIYSAEQCIAADCMVVGNMAGLEIYSINIVD